MQITSLFLQNFRNYEKAHVVFSPGINLIYGPNAHGKTNLLEALYFLITGRSFRTQSLRDLIYFGADFFRLKAFFIKNGVSQTLEVYFDGEKKKLLWNQTPLTSLSALYGILQGVLIAPEDLQILKGSPSLRRRFLDVQIAQVSPLYLHHLSRYQKAMKHRNTLLRRKQTQTLFCLGKTDG